MLGYEQEMKKIETTHQRLLKIREEQQILINGLQLEIKQLQENSNKDIASFDEKVL